VIERVGEAREEVAIFSDLARRMGLGSIHPTPAMRLLARFGVSVKPLRLIDMALRLGPLGDRFGLRKGLSLKALARRPHGMMLDLPLAYEGWQSRLAYPDGRIRLWHDILAGEFARFHAERDHPAPPGLRLFSRRSLKSMNSWMHNCAKLLRSQSPALLIHPADAAARGIASGDAVEVRSAHGRVRVTAEVGADVVEGAVCYPHGWGHGGGWRNANAAPGANINVLLPHGPEAVEKVSGTTFIDGLPVEVERA
jgi:formate dehydrogenase